MRTKMVEEKRETRDVEENEFEEIMSDPFMQIILYLLKSGNSDIVYRFLKQELENADSKE
ncbi:MAG: hypothetical protein NZ954_08430 [Thermofilaceae archaeon]|nr:hypothetical protein [Thermofilaceae archaeon]